MKVIGICILVFFYAVYIGKMLFQKRKGIQTDQIAKGKRRDKVFYTELIMKVATYTVVMVEVLSIFLGDSGEMSVVRIIGVVLGIAGDFTFLTAVITMEDSWRAGIAENDETKMITNGIYKYSRNPAFLGFDSVYIGFLLMFFNIPLLIASLSAILMLHLQILQEEAYLQKAFGEEYVWYQSRVNRYIGKKEN